MIPVAALDRWTRGLDAQKAGAALLAVGVTSKLPAPQHRPAVLPVHPIVEWSFGEERLRTLARQSAALAARAPRSPCRVAVVGDAGAGEIVERLQRAGAVESAFVRADRPRGALRRRPWGWPLRIGLLGFDANEVEATTEVLLHRSGLPASLVDVRRLEDEPALVDVLVTRQTLGEAATALVSSKHVANAVLVTTASLERWPVVEAQVATIRAATGAAAVLLVPDDTGLRDTALGRVVWEMSHALPIDVAVTRAWGGRALLFAEPDSLDRSRVPAVGARRVREVRKARRLMARALPPELPAAARELDRLVVGAFLGEAHEASRIAGVSEAMTAALDTVPDKRWLQARVNPGARKPAANAFRTGDNDVLVFIGPEEKGALSTREAFDDSALPWDEDVEAFRLTVVLVPLVPEGEPQTAQIDLPRFGRSRTAAFTLTVPSGKRRISARVLVVFRNRILQTAMLTGTVGKTARLKDVSVIVGALGNLDDRSSFDLALLANHDHTGTRRLISHASSRTAVTASNEVPVISSRITDELVKAADMSLTRGLASKSARDLLVTLAVHGRDLYNELDSAGGLGRLADAERIQVVSASGDWFLPIELAYGRDAPDKDAAVCTRFLDDPSTCGGVTCPAAPTAEAVLKVICPNAFWGLSKTIERHRFDPELEARFKAPTVLVPPPRAKRRTLSLERALFAASGRVRPADSAPAFAALGLPAATADSWGAWVTSLATADTHLLVLLPHTDYSDPSLEISDDPLVRGRIEQRHVTGGRPVTPVVILFGCRTGGNHGDPGGFASRFMSKQAAIVFHSSTDLKNTHAARMAERLTTLLRDPARKGSSISELLTGFRRAAVHEGLLAALAIAAFGDADWRL